MRARVAVLLVVVAGVHGKAAAEEPAVTTTYTYEPSARAIAAILAPASGFAVDGFVAAGSQGIASGGGRLASPGVAPGCRWLEAGGSVHRLGDQTAAEESIAICLFAAHRPDVTAPGFSIRHQGVYQVRPSLSAPRTLLARRVTGGTLHFEGSAIEGVASRESGTNGGALFPYRVDIDVAEQDGRRQQRWAVAVDCVRFFDPRRLVMGDPHAPELIAHIPADDFAVLGVFMAQSWEGRTHVTAGGMMFARLTGLEVGNRIALDFEARLSNGDIWEYDAAGEPRSERATVATPTGYLGASGAHDWFGWTARWSRELHPTFDGALALEDRLDGSVELRRLAPGVKLTAFAARTGLYAAGGESAGWTGGAALSRSFALGRQLSVVVSAEVARSWYASVEGDATPRPEPTARLLAVLAGNLGR